MGKTKDVQHNDSRIGFDTDSLRNFDKINWQNAIKDACLKMNNGITQPTNCKNCGAPLKTNRCEYCGTVYEGTNRVVLENWRGKVVINGEEMEVYVSQVERTAVDIGSFRDSNGILHLDEITYKRVITLIEI